jgi:hypothetical protein
MCEVAGEKEQEEFMIFKKQNVIIGFILCLISGNLFQASSAQIAKEIETYFEELKSDIEGLAAADEMLKRKISMADKPIAKLMKNRREIVSIIRTNSRGLVVNEKHVDKGPGKQFRNLSRQRWFRVTRRLECYYSLITSAGSEQLFWCVPIKVKQRSGRFRSGGAIIAKIDVKEALRNAARKIDRPFIIYREDEKLFSHDWKKSETGAKREELTINGLDELEAAGLKGGKKAAKKKPQAEAAQKPAAAPAKAVSSQKPVKQERKVPVALIILLITIGALFLAAAVTFKVISGRRHAALVENIDKESSPFEYSETVMLDRSKLFPAGGGNTGTDGTSPPEGAIKRFKGKPKGTAPAPPDEAKANVDAETNQKLNAILSERTKQIRKQVHAEVRFAFLKNMKEYSVSLGRQIQYLNQYAAAGGPRSHDEMVMLQDIIGKLQQIQNSIEGR